MSPLKKKAAAKTATRKAVAKKAAKKTPARTATKAASKKARTPATAVKKTAKTAKTKTAASSRVTKKTAKPEPAKTVRKPAPGTAMKNPSVKKGRVQVKALLPEAKPMEMGEQPQPSPAILQRPAAAYDPTPDTTVPPRGHTSIPHNAQSERAAALKGQRARIGGRRKS